MTCGGLYDSLTQTGSLFGEKNKIKTKFNVNELLQFGGNSHEWNWQKNLDGKIITFDCSFIPLFVEIFFTWLIEN